ncbi:hypothetical protein N7519_002119 [Penicillium mononematosum]|uniref:uncharacterized protein n=1 Tax=Penicillium mononematosum TaxID=268346 RepID=UPI002547C4DA|nr:uncharacterized protein N7519_002119 [Penicillium mononematosum]KAJ6187211.1 hypothetical protein N7519_002119 [Penicillium mononematosum]
MSPVSPWIAALADQCLSFYLGQNDQDEVQVEDIDGCLSFSIRRPALKTAIVVSWGQGENRHCATFTDSKNQIDAIILCDSPDAQGETPPCPPSIKGGPRHLVELSDIKLIFTYSASTPDIYIQVKRFTIRPNAVSRGDVPKPKLKKTLRTLMTMTCEKIQKNQAHVGSNGQTNAGLTHSFVSQRDPNIPTNDSQNNSVSQSLFSQPPSHMRHGPPKGNPMTNRVSLNGSSDLLGLLAPYDQIQTNDTAPRELRGAHRPSLGESESRHSPLPNERDNTADATCASRSATDPSYANLERDVDDLIEECRLRASQPPNESDDPDRAHAVGTGDNQQFSKKRHRGSTDPPSQAAHDDDLGSQGRQSPTTSPSKKRQRIDTGEAMSADQTESEQVRNKPVPSYPRVQIVTTKTDISLSATNPWEGMVKIPLSEIDIPKDQTELLEELKFIPQDPGVSAPLCHVPPNLLTQWNNIARKRQHLTKEGEEGGGEGEGEEEEEGAEEEQVSDRGHTPTPQDAFTSPLSWSPSPIRTPARDVLPRDTVSPEVYRRPARRIPTPSGTQYIVDQPTEDGDVGMVNGSPRAPAQPGQGVIVSSKRVIETVEQQCSPSPEVTTEPINPMSLECDLGNDPFSKPNASKSLHEPQRVKQEHCHDEQPAENPPFKPEVCNGSSVDESDDEPEMETSVPFALGGSLPLSSQPEQELTSSGPSLPRLAGGTIQVVETPAVHITHLNPNKQSKQRAGFQAPSSQQPYSQAAKTSPSSRILDTYRSQDSHGQSGLSQEASNPSLPILADESLRLDVLGTQSQTSSVHAPSQATVQSSSDVVLDSSRPAQRQRGSSIFYLDPSDDPSSFSYPRRHSLSMSQLHEPSQDSSRGPFSLDGASHMQDLSPMESTTFAAHGESPSKCSRHLGRESADTGQKATHSPNAELVARRQGFIGKSNKYAEAQTIYEKFCNDYSPYSGNFAHFAEMCSKLQAMRQKGQLQRSFLWDDFVIQHLEEYPRYFAECSSQESKTLDYEDFFCSKFSRPRHKKRSLTAHGVDIVASQFVPPTRPELGNPPVPQQVTIQGEVTQDKVAQSEVANTSFTASLVEKLSNLHARSFDDVPVPDANMPAATQSSPSPSAGTRPDSVEPKVEADDSFNETIHFQNISSSNDQKLVLSNDDEEMIDATQYDADGIRISFNPNDIDMTETGMDEIEETQEGDDTHHETASIELGDETDDRRISAPASPSPAPPAPPAPLGCLNNAELERPRQRRPWFRSLRNIFPTGPVWSDDPDTPFKRWARQDQNVLQELRRRGGARVQVDEKGVIRRPTYNQQENPGP